MTHSLLDWLNLSSNKDLTIPLLYRNVVHTKREGEDKK